MALFTPWRLIPKTQARFNAGSRTGLFKSVDAGASWFSVNPNIPVSALAIDPKNTSTIYAGSSGVVSKNQNHAASR
jgi:hypothetical protein